MRGIDEKIEMNIADAIMEKPVGFNIGNRHFCLYPPSLGKIYLLSRIVKQIGFNNDIMRTNLYLEFLRICEEDKENVCRIIAYHSMKRKEDVLDEIKVKRRASFFYNKLDNEELSQLLIVVSSWDGVDSYIKYFGIDKERAFRCKVAKLKNKECCSVSFGGLSIYGTLIDFACERYGWTFDYVVWGISYVNLKMLMSDHMTSISLNKEEMRKLHIPDDRTFINGDDPNNIAKIKSMNWD